MSLSKAAVNVRTLFQIAETVLEECGDGYGCGFGAEDAATEGDDLRAGGAGLFQFFIRPTAFRADNCSNCVRVNLC